MLTRARSLFTRVFSFDTPTSQISLAKTFDSNDHNNLDNNISNSVNNNDDSLSDIDDESQQSSSTKEKYKSHSSLKSKSNRHEKSKQNRLINAMQIATSRCNIESMKRLLNNMDIDINHHDQYGMSYLEHAILMGSFDMVDLLIRYGCDLYQGNSTGHSYLYVAIETTTNKSLAIIRLLLESNCSCLRVTDIISLTSPTQIVYINSQDFLLLNTYLLLIFKYHICRMVLIDVLNLLSYLIITNLLLCKNDEHYGLSSCAKLALNHCNNDYISLFIKTLETRHRLKLEYKLKNLQTLSIPSLIPLTNDDIQSYLNRLTDLTKSVFELKHLCRLLIRKNLKHLKTSTITTVVSEVKLQDYLLYTPI